MAHSAHEVGRSVIAHLRATYADICRHWFDDIEAIDLKGGTLRLLIAEPVRLKYLQRSCLRQFTEAAQAVTGRLLAVKFVGEDDLGSDDPPAGGGVDREASPYDEMLISPDNTFDNFVVGPGNRLAQAAAVAVAQRPGAAYNPFFVHGGVGLGKTHLIQAICQAVMRTRPQTRVYYVACDSFTNQFMEAVQAGEMTSFRDRFRNVDVLMIDDIHFLSRRDRTQEEFFHTFNTLYQSGKQIVLSSDAPPNEIPDLEERLVSRFNCGLVVRVEKPCFETRVAILKKKAALRDLALPDDVASYIAATFETNIRELEGAITKLHIVASVNKSPISVELAKEALGPRSPASSAQQPTIQSIVDVVSVYYDVKLADLLSKKRHKSIALPRQVCMWLARKLTRYSLEEIGGYFGGRDHTTVLHAIKTINMRQQSNPGLESDVTHLEQQVLGSHA